MKKLLTLLCSLFVVASVSMAQEYNYKFRLKLKDKGKTSYSIEKPEEFLSPRAIERRMKQKIAIDSTDLLYQMNI